MVGSPNCSKSTDDVLRGLVCCRLCGVEVDNDLGDDSGGRDIVEPKRCDEESDLW